MSDHTDVLGMVVPGGQPIAYEEGQGSSMSELRTRLVRIAGAHPSLRGPIGRLLQPEHNVQAERDVHSDFGIISNSARTAFETEILPQIKSMAQSPQQVQAVREHIHAMLEDTFKKKDSLYLLLIRYKSLDVGDAHYLADLKRAVDQWAREHASTEPL